MDQMIPTRKKCTPTFGRMVPTFPCNPPRLVHMGMHVDKARGHDGVPIIEDHRGLEYFLQFGLVSKCRLADGNNILYYPLPNLDCRGRRCRDNTSW